MSAHDYDPRTFSEDRRLYDRGLLGFLTGRRKKVVLDLLHDAVRAKENPSILDVGCGYGEMLRDYGMCRGIGVDINYDALVTARNAAPQARFALSHVERLPFSDNSFDGVLCSEVLEHVRDPESLARELMRIVKPGGAVAVTVPNETMTTLGRAVMGKKPWKSPAHLWAFTPRRLAGIFPGQPECLRHAPFGWLPFSLSTNVVAVFRKTL